MASAYDSTTDTLIAALRMIAQHSVNAALSTELSGQKAIEKTFGYPAVLGVIPATEMPALCVYVSQSAVRPFSSAFTYRRATVTFDYYVQPTARHDLNDRWPLLGRVFEELAFAVCRGTWTDGGSKNLLDDANVVDVMDETFRVQYQFAEDGNFVFPFFRATIDIDYNSRPADTSALDDVVDLDVDLDLDGHVENPLVEALLEVDP